MMSRIRRSIRSRLMGSVGRTRELNAEGFNGIAPRLTRTKSVTPKTPKILQVSHTDGRFFRCYPSPHGSRGRSPPAGGAPQDRLPLRAGGVAEGCRGVLHPRE